LKQDQIKKIITSLKKEIKNFDPPLIDKVIDEYGKKPFLILISCLLSLRSKDSVTIHVVRDLFKVAKTPKEILAIPLNQLEKLIFKIGFYRNKAKILKEVSKTIHEKFSEKVPKSMDELLNIKGIGRKTANIVFSEAFGSDEGIAVDVHVHRISNRLGIIKTKTAEESEKKLMKILPKKYWGDWNHLLVVWGQNICAPRNPKCSKCAIKGDCIYFKKLKI